MHIILILLFIWFVWGMFRALIRQNIQSNMVLTIVLNKEKLKSFVEALTVSFGEAPDQYDRIRVLTAQLPRFFSLVSGLPVNYWEKWVENNPKRIEAIERAMYNDRDYLRNSMSEIDRITNQT
jgi:hypothetical protein